MLVSHDRAMLREVCDEFWLVTRGGVLPFDGDLDDYQRWLLDVSRANARGQPAPPVPGPSAQLAPAVLPSPTRSTAVAAPAAPRSGAKQRDDRKAQSHARVRLADQTRPLRNELAQIDQRLARLAAERSEYEGALSGTTLEATAIADAGRQLAHVAAEVAMLEERWLELQQQLESMATATR
jgi:ATP-binding cassette subfamily F protein 3